MRPKNIRWDYNLGLSIQQAQTTLEDETNGTAEYDGLVISSPPEYTMTFRIENNFFRDEQAMYAGYKNYNSYCRAIRRTKRQKEQERRRRLKSGGKK